MSKNKPLNFLKFLLNKLDHGKENRRKKFIAERMEAYNVEKS